jgi:hypothetical protein
VPAARRTNNGPVYSDCSIAAAISIVKGNKNVSDVVNDILSTLASGDGGARSLLRFAPAAALAAMAEADLCIIHMRAIDLYFLRAWSSDRPALQIAHSVANWMLERGYIARVDQPDTPDFDFYLLTADGRRCGRAMNGATRA